MRISVSQHQGQIYFRIPGANVLVENSNSISIVSVIISRMVLGCCLLHKILTGQHENLMQARSCYGR